MPVACAPPHASTTSEPRLTWPRIACWLLAASFQSPTYVVSCLTFGLVRLAPFSKASISAWQSGTSCPAAPLIVFDLVTPPAIMPARYAPWYMGSSNSATLDVGLIPKVAKFVFGNFVATGFVASAQVEYATTSCLPVCAYWRITWLAPAVSCGAPVVTFRSTTPSDASFLAALKPWLHQGSLLPHGRTSAMPTAFFDGVVDAPAPVLVLPPPLSLPHAASSTIRPTARSPLAGPRSLVRLITNPPPLGISSDLMNVRRPCGTECQAPRAVRCSARPRSRSPAPRALRCTAAPGTARTEPSCSSHR